MDNYVPLDTSLVSFGVSDVQPVVDTVPGDITDTTDKTDRMFALICVFIGFAVAQFIG